MKKFFDAKENLNKKSLSLPRVRWSSSCSTSISLTLFLCFSVSSGLLSVSRSGSRVLTNLGGGGGVYRGAGAGGGGKCGNLVVWLLSP